MSRKFKYVGPHDAVEITGVGSVERGHQIEVEPDVADGLDGQADWEHVPDRKRSRAAKKAAAKKATPSPRPELPDPSTIPTETSEESGA